MKFLIANLYLKLSPFPVLQLEIGYKAQAGFFFTIPFCWKEEANGNVTLLVPIIRSTCYLL